MCSGAPRFSWTAIIVTHDRPVSSDMAPLPMAWPWKLDAVTDGASAARASPAPRATAHWVRPR